MKENKIQVFQGTNCSSIQRIGSNAFRYKSMTSIISNTVIIYKMLITSEDIQSVVKDFVFKDKTKLLKLVMGGGTIV